MKNFLCFVGLHYWTSWAVSENWNGESVWRFRRCHNCPAKQSAMKIKGIIA